MGACAFFTDALERKAQGKDAVSARICHGCAGIHACVQVGGECVSGGGQAFGRRYGISLGIGVAGDAETKGGSVDFIGGRMAQAASVGVVQDVAQEGFASHAASGISAAYQKVASRLAICREGTFRRRAERAVFGTPDKVDDGVWGEVGRAGLKRFGAARYERPVSRVLDGFAVDEGIVEGVSGNAFAFQFASAIAQPAFGLDADTGAVEALLVSAEGGCAEVGDARVGIEVEALARIGLYGCRRGSAAESVHDEHGAAAMFRPVCRKRFGRKAFSAPVNRRHAEAVDDAWFGFEGIVGFAHVGTVVESSSSHTGIDYVSFCTCGRFERVFGGSPAQAEGVFCLPSSMAKWVTGRGWTV